MIIIDDKNVCIVCGAYFQDNGYCVNGHLKSDNFPHDKNNDCEGMSCGNCRHFHGFSEWVQGQCRCSASKFYFDVVSANNSCGYFDKAEQ